MTDILENKKSNLEAWKHRKQTLSCLKSGNFHNLNYGNLKEYDIWEFELDRDIDFMMSTIHLFKDVLNSVTLNDISNQGCKNVDKLSM